MMRKFLILGLAAVAAPVAFAAPASAATIAPAVPTTLTGAPLAGFASSADAFVTPAAAWEDQRRRAREWRGRDGRYYCRRPDGTTGLIVGGAAGALAGRAIDTRGDRTLGTLLGAAGGAVLGREIERGTGRRCR